MSEIPPKMREAMRWLVAAGATGGVFVDIGAGAGDRPIDREGFYEWVIGLIEDRLALAEDVRSKRRKACRLDVAIDSGGEYGVAEVGEDPGAWLLPGYRRCGVTAYLRVPEIDETEADD